MPKVQIPLSDLSTLNCQITILQYNKKCSKLGKNLEVFVEKS